MSEPTKRFIAGAVCPACGEMDRILMWNVDDVPHRECVACGERFTTFETAELVMPRLIKSDGSRQPFDEDKLRALQLRASR